MQQPGGKKRGPGQPAFKPTKKHRDQVKLYMAGGISEPVIAHRLGICQNTLRKHFADELHFGRDMKVADNLDRLERAADDGNVTAMKHLDVKFGATAAQHAFTAPEARPPAIGKKEAAQLAAEKAGVGTEWGDDLRTENARPN